MAALSSAVAESTIVYASERTGEFSDADRASINNAVATIRATRQTVMLGMPGTRPPTAEEPSR